MMPIEFINMSDNLLLVLAIVLRAHMQKYQIQLEVIFMPSFTHTTLEFEAAKLPQYVLDHHRYVAGGTSILGARIELFHTVEGARFASDMYGRKSIVADLSSK